ncbi:MAG: TraB/GumN family protein [Lewinella sp.]|nr:TraB/GumN family protein [Lewinella sp.]
MKLSLTWRLLILLLLPGTMAWAQPAAPAHAPTTEENSLLWEISGAGLQAPSYLFGTIHMIPEEHFVLTDVTRKAFTASGTVAFEIDTEEMTNPMAMMGLLNKMYMANDTTLADLMSEEDYTFVETEFNEMGLPMFFLKRVKPMFLTVLVGEDMNTFDPANQDQVKSYELELTQMAKTQEKPIVGLETAEFQMSLFDSIPYREQATMLLETLRSEADSTGVGMLDRMIELYVNQDIVGMQSMMQEDEAGGIGNYEELLLLKRNRNWIPVMSNLMAEGTTFFAVGAGHLAGEEGVIALLRAAGYTLRPIR